LQEVLQRSQTRTQETPNREYEESRLLNQGRQASARRAAGRQEQQLPESTERRLQENPDLIVPTEDQAEATIRTNYSTMDFQDISLDDAVTVRLPIFTRLRAILHPWRPRLRGQVPQSL